MRLEDAVLTIRVSQLLAYSGVLRADVQSYLYLKTDPEPALERTGRLPSLFGKLRLS